jgi:hypothetical protein
MFEFRTMDVQHHQRKSVGPDKRLATLEGERCTCNAARRNSNHHEWLHCANPLDFASEWRECPKLSLLPDASPCRKF